MGMRCARLIDWPAFGPPETLLMKERQQDTERWYGGRIDPHSYEGISSDLHWTSEIHRQTDRQEEKKKPQIKHIDKRLMAKEGKMLSRVKYLRRNYETVEVGPPFQIPVVSNVFKLHILSSSALSKNTLTVEMYIHENTLWGFDWHFNLLK